MSPSKCTRAEFTDFRLSSVSPAHNYQPMRFGNSFPNVEDNDIYAVANYVRLLVENIMLLKECLLAWRSSSSSLGGTPIAFSSEITRAVEGCTTSMIPRLCFQAITASQSYRSRTMTIRPRVTFNSFRHLWWSDP